MKKSTIRYSLLLLLGMGYGHIQAQTLSRSVIASGGSSFSSSNLQADWTIGESITGDFSSTSLQVGQGFQQGPDAVSTGTVELSGNQLLLYPNPTNGLLYVKFPGQFTDRDELLFLSADGKQIAIPHQPNGKDTWLFDLSGIAGGTYFLCLINGGSQTVYRIVRQ
jgi:hypothetical protein